MRVRSGIALVLCVVLDLLSVCRSEVVSYSRHSLIRVTPIKESHLKDISKLKAKFGKGVDVWLGTTAVNRSSDVLVSPSALQDLLRHIKAQRIPHAVLSHDVGKAFEDESESSSDSRGFFEEYQNVENIQEYLENLSFKYSGHVSLFEIGLSFEDRLLHVLRVSSDSADMKPAFWIQGGAHAREKIGPATVLYMANKLSRLYGSADDVTKLVDAFDWYFLPLLNPDGYTYCDIDPLWRKTRSRHPNAGDCIGVDANRNWNFKWNDTSGKGASSDPCENNYAGPYALSEPEVKATTHFIQDNLEGRLRLFIDFHSYSQKWLAPWGYTSKLPSNYKEQVRLANIATSALKKKYGTEYKVGSSGNDMYTVSGGGRDWAYGVMKATYSYVVELRDKGKYGFLLPPRFILPTAKETWDGVKAMGLEMVKVFNDIVDEAES